MGGADTRLDRIIAWAAAGIAFAVFLSLPAIYFAIAYQYQSAALETTAEIKAHIVSQMINANPAMWKYHDHYLSDLLERGPGRAEGESQRILDDHGEVVVESRDAVLPPSITHTETLYDSGNPAGRIEISRSVRPLLVDTALLGVAGLILGSGVFFVLTVFPRRSLARAVESLFQEQERAQVTLRSIGDGVITTDMEGRIVLINAVAETLTGWPHEEAKGRPFAEVFGAFSMGTRRPEEDLIPKVLAAGGVVSFPAPSLLVVRDGTERTIVKTGAPIHDRQGRVIGVVLAFQDVTEKRRIQEEHQKTEKLESLGVLAGGIAHDFNNILTAILGNISLAEARAAPGAGIAGRLAEASKACQRAKALTNQLLTFSRGGAPVKRAGDIGDLLREAAGFALTGSNVRCEFAIPRDIRAVEVDEGQFSQVVHNLIINAHQAMPEGGLIRVSAENALVEAGGSLPLPPGDYVRISIADNGSGIPPEHLSRIFDPYFTTKQTGSGLGLAISYFIVKNHGGYITVESEPGAGTTFLIHVPASARDAAARREEPAPPRRGGGRILVLDDEESVRDVAREMLERIGYEAVVASDGAEAVCRYREAQESGRPFDAVILDLTVPGGMGGREAMRRLLRIDPAAKGIVSSGYSNDPVMADFPAYGFRGVLAKPYRIAELGEVLSAVIDPDRARIRPAS